MATESSQSQESENVKDLAAVKQTPATVPKQSRPPKCWHGDKLECRSCLPMGHYQRQWEEEQLPWNREQPTPANFFPKHHPVWKIGYSNKLY